MNIGRDTPFPDFARAASALLATVPTLDAAHVGLVRPPAEDFKKKLPFVATYRIGGGNDGITDDALMVLDVFAATYPVGFALAGRCVAALAASPLTVVLDSKPVLIDDASVSTPNEVPYGDSAVRLWTTTYRWSARRQFSLLAS